MEKDSTPAYQTVHSASWAKKMAVTFSNIQLQELFQRWRQGVQPWGDFVDVRKFASPKAVAPAGRRILRNVDRFRSNYVFVVVCVIAFAILTSPLLLVAVAISLGASYAILLKSPDKRIILAGHELTQTQQFGLVGIVTVLLFWFLGTGSVVFWIIGLSLVLILGHAAALSAEDEFRPVELRTAEVV
jgi:hypothetical protein